MKFRAKPVEIMAVKLTTSLYMAIRKHMPTDEWVEFVKLGIGNTDYEISDGGLNVFTIYGWEFAAIGDWIIKDMNGDYRPCKEDVFERTYEFVKEKR